MDFDFDTKYVERNTISHETHHHNYSLKLNEVRVYHII